MRTLFGNIVAPTLRAIVCAPSHVTCHCMMYDRGHHIDVLYCSAQTNAPTAHVYKLSNYIHVYLRPYVYHQYVTRAFWLQHDAPRSYLRIAKSVLNGQSVVDAHRSWQRVVHGVVHVTRGITAVPQHLQYVKDVNTVNGIGEAVWWRV